MNAYIAIKRACSRCPRVEEESVPPEEAVKRFQAVSKTPAAVVVTVRGVVAGTHENLCSVCEKIVQRYVSLVTAKQEQMSSIRTTQKIEVDVSAEAKP